MTIHHDQLVLKIDSYSAFVVWPQPERGTTADAPLNRTYSNRDRPPPCAILTPYAIRAMPISGPVIAVLGDFTANLVQMRRSLEYYVIFKAIAGDLTFTEPEERAREDPCALGQIELYAALRVNAAVQ